MKLRDWINCKLLDNHDLILAQELSAKEKRLSCCRCGKRFLVVGLTGAPWTEKHHRFYSRTRKVEYRSWEEGA